MKGRNMKLDNIARYIDQVQFRKKLFGVNTSEVYAAMQEMDVMYQDAMEHYSEILKENYDSREEAVRKNERKVRDLADKANSVIEVRRRDQRRIKELEERLKHASLERAQYRSQTDILADSISDTQKCREEILMKARQEAAEILQMAQEKSMRIYRENSQSVQREQEKYTENLEHIRMAKAKAEDNLQLIRIDLYDLCEMLSGLREEMRPVLEEEKEEPYIETGHEKQQKREKCVG